MIAASIAWTDAGLTGSSISRRCRSRIEDLPRADRASAWSRVTGERRPERRLISRQPDLVVNPVPARSRDRENQSDCRRAARAEQWCMQGFSLWIAARLTHCASMSIWAPPLRSDEPSRATRKKPAAFSGHGLLGSDTCVMGAALPKQPRFSSPRDCARRCAALP